MDLQYFGLIEISLVYRHQIFFNNIANINHDYRIKTRKFNWYFNEIQYMYFTFLDLKPIYFPKTKCYKQIHDSSPRNVCKSWLLVEDVSFGFDIIESQSVKLCFVTCSSLVFVNLILNVFPSSVSI